MEICRSRNRRRVLHDVRIVFAGKNEIGSTHISCKLVHFIESTIQDMQQQGQRVSLERIAALRAIQDEFGPRLVQRLAEENERLRQDLQRLETTLVNLNSGLETVQDN